MNYLILSLHGLLSKRKIKILKIVFVAAAASFLGVMMIVCRIRESKVVFLFFYVVVSAFLMRLLYGKSSPRQLISRLLLYYGIGCIVAGILLSVKQTFSDGNISMLLILLTASVLYTVSKKIVPKVLEYRKTVGNCYPVKVSFRGRTFEGTGFVDTGNRLTEPISGETVHVADYSLVKALFTKEECERIETIMTSGVGAASDSVFLRMIPFHSVGKSLGLMPGLKVDSIQIWKEGKWEKKDRQWLGISMSELTKGKEYQILLNEEIIL